jgi:dihydrolipoamide dehydrogenase
LRIQRVTESRRDDGIALGLRDNHRIVGWAAVGAGVSELRTAFSHSLGMDATLGEAVQEAELRSLGHALHI